MLGRLFVVWVVPVSVVAVRIIYTRVRAGTPTIVPVAVSAIKVHATHPIVQTVDIVTSGELVKTRSWEGEHGFEQHNRVVDRGEYAERGHLGREY